MKAVLSSIICYATIFIKWLAMIMTFSDVGNINSKDVFSTLKSPKTSVAISSVSP